MYREVQPQQDSAASNKAQPSPTICNAPPECARADRRTLRGGLSRKASCAANAMPACCLPAAAASDCCCCRSRCSSLHRCCSRWRCCPAAWRRHWCSGWVLRLAAALTCHHLTGGAQRGPAHATRARARAVKGQSSCTVMPAPVAAAQILRSWLLLPAAGRTMSVHVSYSNRSTLICARWY